MEKRGTINNNYSTPYQQLIKNHRDKPREDCEPTVERDVESIVREGRENLEKDEINKAISILIAKTDR